MSKQSDRVSESEEQLVERAQRALSSCNWEIGECASRWTTKFAKGRTDADFGALIGLSSDQVYQRRRVWETFGDVNENYEGLRWSHYYTCLNWDDAAECMQWASEMQATVAEMKAWRRAQHGEDLSTPGDDDDGDYLPVEAGFVQLIDGEPVERSGRTGESGGSASGSRDATASSFARESDGEQQDEYTPYSKGARGTAEKTATKAAPSSVALIRRAAKALQGINAQLSPEVLEAFSEAPGEIQQDFLKGIKDLYSKAAGLM